MLKRTLVGICALLIISNIYGCVAFIAGAAGGAGTAMWLSGKIVQDFQVSMDKAGEATKSALKSLNLDIVKETRNPKVIQIISRHDDGRKIWIDIDSIEEKMCSIEIRVGVSGDQDSARSILDRIKEYM